MKSEYSIFKNIPFNQEGFETIPPIYNFTLTASKRAPTQTVKDQVKRMKNEVAKRYKIDTKKYNVDDHVKITVKLVD